jgi:DASS family divalent anion:Na+ symporter
MLEKVNYKGFVWPLIVGIALFLLTPFKPATITIAGWQ